MAGSPQSSKMQSSPHRRQSTIKPYLVGTALALILTAIPFGLIATRALRPMHTLLVIGVAATIQVVVHLRYFLQLDLKPSSQNKLIALCFAAVVLFILFGGALWIMLNLNYRKM
jgi:cytochrome o ubiquinol oxidase subunit IV